MRVHLTTTAHAGLLALCLIASPVLGQDDLQLSVNVTGSAYEGQLHEIQLSATGGSGGYTFDVANQSGQSIVVDNGALRWTPAFEVVERAQGVRVVDLDVSVLDSVGNRDAKIVPVQVHHVNRPPVVESETVCYAILLEPVGECRVRAEDPDQDPLRISAKPTDLKQNTNVSSDGTLSWTPTSTQWNDLVAGEWRLPMEVSDGKEVVMTTLVVRANQDGLIPPVVYVSDVALQGREGRLLTFTAGVRDANGLDNVRELVVDGKPADAKWEYDKTTGIGTFTWTPLHSAVPDGAGPLDVVMTVRATDWDGLTDEKEVRVTIADAVSETKVQNEYRATMQSATGLVLALRGEPQSLATAQEDYTTTSRRIDFAKLATSTIATVFALFTRDDVQTFGAGASAAVTALVAGYDQIFLTPSDFKEDMDDLTSALIKLDLRTSSYSWQYSTNSQRVDDVSRFRNDSQALDGLVQAIKTDRPSLVVTAPSEAEIHSRFPYYAISER